MNSLSILKTSLRSTNSLDIVFMLSKVNTIYFFGFGGFNYFQKVTTATFSDICSYISFKDVI